MAILKKGEKEFTVLDEIQEKHGRLLELILATESMDDAERQYWFDILPSMNDEQVQKLYDILETERKKLDELEQKYQQEITALNNKHTTEWQEYEIKKKKEEIAAAETADKNEKDATVALGDW